MDTYTNRSDDFDTRRHSPFAGSVRTARNGSFIMPALLGVVVFFMVAPAVVAAISMFDRDLLGPVQEVSWIGMLTTSLQILSLASMVVLARAVACTREDA
jgi:hypothetical protein